jgi:2-polyprenyl-6-methoxyphenol hydroxylase-like FAD-dependent oxidoreductase
VAREGSPSYEAGAQLLRRWTQPRGLITVTDEHSYLFVLENDPGVRIPRDRFPALMRLALAPFNGAIADVRDAIVDPEHVYYSAPTPFLLPAPWHVGRVLLIGDAAHATMPQLAYGAGLALEDGVVLGDLAGTVGTVEELMNKFTARRFERCGLIVSNGIQISRSEQNPDTPDSHPRRANYRQSPCDGRSDLSLSRPVRAERSPERDRLGGH